MKTVAGSPPNKFMKNAVVFKDLYCYNTKIDSKANNKKGETSEGDESLKFYSMI